MKNIKNIYIPEYKNIWWSKMIYIGIQNMVLKCSNKVYFEWENINKEFAHYNPLKQKVYLIRTYFYTIGIIWLLYCVDILTDWNVKEKQQSTLPSYWAQATSQAVTLHLSHTIQIKATFYDL